MRSLQSSRHKPKRVRPTQNSNISRLSTHSITLQTTEGLGADFVLPSRTLRLKNPYPRIGVQKRSLLAKTPPNSKGKPSLMLDELLEHVLSQATGRTESVTASPKLA
jgi:hypothetical protein